MNKKLIWLIIVAVVIIGVGFYIYNSVRPIDCCHGEQYLNQTTPTADWKTYTRYMIVLRTSEKAGSQITEDIDKIFSTFKFAN